MVRPVSLLTVSDVVMRYGSVAALKGVSLDVQAGTVHGLLGENGAGKSTLVRIIAGLQRPTSGEVFFAGERVVDADVRTMEKHGVFLVTQEPMIVDQLSVADNLMLGRWPKRGGWIDDGALHRRSREFLLDTGLDSHTLAGKLTAVEKRKLNILRALHGGGRLVILDEPTAALTTADRTHLFDFMIEQKRQGVSFLFISHYNEEILEICDTVSVLRDGNMVGHDQPVRDLNASRLSEMVVGRDVDLFERTAQPSRSTRRPAWSLRRIRGEGITVDHLDIGHGEIVGFAGLPGSGARELARCLYGLRPVYEGTLEHDGNAMTIPAHPAQALQAGIAFLSEDRLKDGIVGIQSIRENITLSSLGEISHGGWLSGAKEKRLIDRFMAMFAIKAENAEKPVGQLSGGNQQKVCISRMLATEPRLLILNEPTRGIDVGIKEEVHRIVDELTLKGVAVIVVTSDLDEMLRIVDRVVMFVDGEIRTIRDARGLTKDDVFDVAFSAKAPVIVQNSYEGAATP